MPKYVVVDSLDTWLEVGEYDSPEEALEGAKDSSDFNEPNYIYVYEVVGETEYVKKERSEEVTYAKI